MNIDNDIKSYCLVVVDNLTNEVVVEYYRKKHHWEYIKYNYDMRMYLYYYLAKNYIDLLVESRKGVTVENYNHFIKKNMKTFLIKKTTTYTIEAESQLDALFKFKKNGNNAMFIEIGRASCRERV